MRLRAVRAPLGLIAAVVLVATAAGVSPARADVGDHLPRLARLTAEAERAPDAQSYAAMRRVWLQWDRGDPAEVEASLDAIAHARRGATRVYAELLQAYARRRRGDLDGARSRIAALGYVGKWAIVGSFDNEGKTGLTRAFQPETAADGAIFTKTYEGKERKVKWRVSPGRSPYGWVDTGALVRPTENVCVYATTLVRDPKLAAGRSRRATLWVGSSGAVRVWFDGTLAIDDGKYRDFDSDREGRAVTMHAGYNRILVKVCGSGSAPVFALRVGAADGSPDPSVEADVEAAHFADAQATWASKAPLPAGGVLGPLAALEKAARGAGTGKKDATGAEAYGGSPATLEADAEYLVLTQSDDESDHLARDLATRAATKAPTVRRLLLAAQLVEGRNQSAEWIAKAEALVKKGGVSSEDRIHTLLARAAHERSGTNWRDAVPYYDRVLAIDPDNVAAVLARVELYGEANLRATALTFLRHALARRPRSVALVRAMVDSLRQEDRTTEADEMEDRYAQLRFDDSTFLQGRIDLAVARRDTQAAQRWIDRLVATDPDGTDKLVSAAQAYVTLGNRARAVALYKLALQHAPEDVDTMTGLADLYALGGEQGEQVALLKKVLALRPQDKDVREHLAHLEPSKPRPDEAYALPSKTFLAWRGAPAAGRDRRTLVDLTVTTVFPNGLSSKFHQVVFQPLTDRAAQSSRVYAFAYETDSQAVQLRGVHVYRKSGEVDDTFDSSVGGADDPSIATYTSSATYRVQFPRLSAGDVVELDYRVEDVAQRNAFADYFGDVGYLQSDEPLHHAEYVLLTPKTRTFYFNQPKVPGLHKTVQDKGDTRVYRFVAENVPPIEPEPNQPPYTELLGHVHVSTYKSWDEMGAWYWGLVKDQFTADDEVRRRVAMVTKGKKTDIEKVRAIYDYVVQKTRYVALEFGIHGFKPYRCAQIFARGYGDCKDKATLIVTMLQEAGIPATIVIVRTGLRGDFEDYPASLAPFDHAIAYVPSLDMYLDGTAEYTGSTELPAMDRGALALQVNQGKPKLVHLPQPPASASVVSRSIVATLAPDGSAQLDWSGSVTGAAAASWRVRYHADATRKDRVQEDLGSDLSGLAVQSVQANDLEDVETPPSLKVRGKVAAFARKDGTSLSVPVGPSEHMVRDFASLSTRKLDLRFHARTTSETDYVVKLPPGAKVLSSPSPSSSTSPFGSHHVTVETVPGGVHVHTTVVFSKMRIPVAEYPAFRAWCEQVDKGLGQRLLVGGAK